MYRKSSPTLLFYVRQIGFYRFIEHPFYSNGAWVAAEDLQIGDSIQQSDGTTGTLEKIESENRIQAMYNLTALKTQIHIS